MPYINTVETESLQAGVVLSPPTSTVEIWPSLDPTMPFSVQNLGIANMVGSTNQIGLYNGVGAWNQLGAYNGVGVGAFVGGHNDAQPYYDSAAFDISYHSPLGDLKGAWKYNGSTICAPCPSDQRAKTNIKNLTSSLSKVLQLRGVSFDWNSEIVPNKASKQKSSVGLIAQEVEKIIPEVVVTERIEDQDLKTVEYANLTSILIEAIKEQQKQIEDLKETVRKLSPQSQKVDGVCYDV